MAIHALNTSTHIHQPLSPTESDTLRRLKQVARGGFFSSDRALAEKLKAMTPIELDHLLRSYFADLAQGEEPDPIKTIEHLAAVIPLERLESATLGSRGEALQEAKEMLEEAKLYLSATENVSPTLRNRLRAIIEGIVSIIESVLSAFGMSDFFKPSESEMHAAFKGQKLMMLISLFGMIATSILPLIGVAAGMKIIGGILFGIIALSVVWPFIKPMPTNLPANAENWTVEIRKGGCPAQGRKESLDEMANILKMGRHVMLVGPSRVGKSLTAKAFAQAIERGDYPELKGKSVFRLNTTDLVDQKASMLGGGNNILYKIREEMGRHADNIILVLDEVHMACKDKAKMADQLKTFLDQGGPFPHVIGITTAEEYEKYVKDNQAFALRFDRVDIQNTNQDETIKILSDNVLRSPSKKACCSKSTPKPSKFPALLSRWPPSNCSSAPSTAQKKHSAPTQKKELQM
jgi:ATP-dependent Clp protease ATP-binding subunit ClpA